MDAKKGADGRFEVHVDERDDDSYMYSNTHYTYVVASSETGDELLRFSGSWDESASGSSKRGVETVDIEGNEAVATHYDGTIERVALPTAITIVDESRQIELAYADGTTRRQPRNAVLFFARGRPYAVTELVNPPKR